MKEIEITVKGKTNTGKTAISQEIVSLLNSLGFDVEWQNTQDVNNGRKKITDQSQRILAIRNSSPKIIVKECHQ